ncbi:MAG: DUF177 domain-containing protein [Ignavibacteria bacterium]|nr:DUF177 domain-containing protein [Ignavibacteria bacterium]
MFRINIHNLKEGEHIYKFEASSQDFDFNETEVGLTEKVFITAVLYKAGNQISVKLELNGKFKFPCDRCLDDYVYDFSTAFPIIYKYEFKSAPADEIHDDDIKFIPPNTVFIDLKEDIRDFILLSIPMKKAPEDIDGICSFCKKDISKEFTVKQQEEINPVWEKLIKQKK